MRLTHSESKEVLIENLEVAKTLWARTKGLLGRSHLASDQALWIWHCNAIHTFFMKFAIDLVFVDNKMVVVKVIKGVRPGRVTSPLLRASSVIELSAGFLDKHPLKAGDRLHVDPALS